jgi:hypothetical protein
MAFYSMSKLCRTPGLDISKPIDVKGGSWEGQFLFPKELAPLNKVGIPTSDWWIYPSKDLSVKTDTGFPPALLDLRTSSNSGFLFMCKYETYLKRFSSIELSFDQFTFKVSNPGNITPQEVADLLIMQDAESWVFIAGHCSLNKAQKELVSRSCRYYGIDFASIEG